MKMKLKLETTCSSLNKIFILIIILNLKNWSFILAEKINYNVVHAYADKLGMELFHLGDFITRRNEVQESFKNSKVVQRSGPNIVRQMAQDLENMMESKISAVRRIMDTAENTAVSHEKEQTDVYYSYYSAKEMVEPNEPIPTTSPRELDDAGEPKIYVSPKEIILTPKTEFFNTPVNLSVSSVHVPTNVYDRAPEVIHGIQWSENLDQIFRDNYKKDPTLSWQFYGSATGFMRQYPASKWKIEPVDLFDCRLRSWFMEAANSPKDVIILMDGSGSMTGQRLDVAKHVVKTVLDTLGTNDFVNIYTFGAEVNRVVGCFEDTLVQATLGNVREFKEGIELVKTDALANYTLALTKAFEILEQHKAEERAAACNQAIMIITDGAPFSYQEIFEQFNWRDLPFKPVRVFTYLIGKEVADTKDIKWMACENQGYFVHLSDMAEVREMVLNYIPVMARPLVLGGQDHPVIWTQVYADQVDIKMTDWLWEVKQSENQREDVLEFRKVSYHMLEPDEIRRRDYRRNKLTWYQPVNSDVYQFVTTVSMPVFDRRENATRIANLLGVAGTDVPIKDIKKLLSPFLLGVNGYAFIVTNNGYVLFHPDFRPIFEGRILKPAYNSVDMIEVELLDDDRLPRDFNPVLLTIRDSIINQSTESKWMLVKNHFDEMKRVVRIKRQYYWTKIKNTPFTLVITYPEQYSVYRIQNPTEEDIHRMHIKDGNTLNYFDGNKWKIHPDWLYCKKSSKTFATPEEELLYFLKQIVQPGWKWPLSRSALPSEQTSSMFCDHDLMQSIVYDAKVTEWFSKNSSFNFKEEKRNEFKQRFGVTVAFLATHSGLTRWQEFHSNMADEIGAGEIFGQQNKRAIDEVWYKRAVDQHFVQEESFVYSVPFDAGESVEEIMITASHAIFHNEGSHSAPAAVVGFQFQHSAFYKLYRNITGNGCNNEEKACYILDNNGFIIIAPYRHETGKFFGEINGFVMNRLVDEKVYKRVLVYDYQAVCYAFSTDFNSSNYLYSPLLHFIRFLKWVLTSVIMLIMHFTSLSADFIDQYLDENITDYPVNPKSTDWLRLITLRRSRLKPCDMMRELYTLYNNKDNIVFNITEHACERPFVVLPIPASNLIFLVIDQSCEQMHVDLSVNPFQIEYSQNPNQTLACYKHARAFTRVRPKSCINKHINESDIKICGQGNSLFVSLILLLFCVLPAFL